MDDNLHQSDEPRSIADLIQLPPSGFVQRSNAPTISQQIDVTDNRMRVEVHAPAGATTDESVAELIRKSGLDPDEWTVTGFRRSDWTLGNGEPGEATRYTFARKPDQQQTRQMDAELAAITTREPAHQNRAKLINGSAFLVLLGDLQIGKLESHGTEVERTINCLDQAADELEWYKATGHNITHVHVAWLGDHIEGFESQSGRNSWRTPIDLNSQIRIVRRLMLYGVQRFAPLTDSMTVVAVPGNHGRVTAAGGMTHFNDSFDTEALVAVSDACEQNPAAYGHVQFFVPETDEMTVVTEVAGTVIAHAHGHQWSPGRHKEWWANQSQHGRLAGTHVLVAGHLHHMDVQESGRLTFIQVPSLETESTWFRHRTGTPGNPGILTALTRDGRITNWGRIYA